MTTILLLRAPSRRPGDVGVSLRAPAGCTRTADAMEAAALATKCPPDVARRVRACILHSGRYDCRIAAGAVLLLARHKGLLAACRGTIEITDQVQA